MSFRAKASDDLIPCSVHESIKTTEKSYARWVKGRQDRLDSLVMATWRPSPVETSVEGIESARKRSFNDMQSQG